ncbi:hypothetical protein GMO_25000 [Gluconobacter morbifer G707]|uniref:Uncharacterized protein n=1 Tax=Gluconobacter morbifer G707 TaxID=1088869 RepID=G6XL77_9PROT|nr:hypothetical protein GMO_25000 [Gluconobacter morbifer G707]
MSLPFLSLQAREYGYETTYFLMAEKCLALLTRSTSRADQIITPRIGKPAIC